MHQNKESDIADNRLDQLAKTLASEEELPRRRMLGRVAAAIGGGFLAAVAGERPAAAAPPVRCPPGFTNCGGLCRDTTTNPDHCGSCGTACATNQLCRGGTCVQCTCTSTSEPPPPEPTPCPAGQTQCSDGTCADLLTDPSNCGQCGNVCPSGTCTNGNCSTVCEPGSSLGEACTVGVGACHRTGVLVCTDDGSGYVCSAEPGTPSPEICNGIDDDCDGMVDEGPMPGVGDPCEGPNGAGTTVCVNGQIICQ